MLYNYPKSGYLPDEDAVLASPYSPAIVQHLGDVQLEQPLYFQRVEVAPATRQNRGGERFASPYFASSYPIPKECLTALHDALWSHAEALVVDEHLVLADGRQQPPKTLGDYRFVPVLHQDPSFLQYSLSSVNRNLATSQGVSFEYEKPDGMPFMDGRFGLGLAFRGRLVALCSGGIAKEGPVILQLQDVSNRTPPDTTDPKVLHSFAYSNGLRSGIDWKATLVRGWCSLMSKSLPEVLPQTLGMPVWVQSAENNNWVNRQEYASNGLITGRYVVDQERLTRLMTTYNMTAHRLGGIIDPQTRNSKLPSSFVVGQAA